MYERHGLSKTPEHKAWRAMRDRCCNPCCVRYPLYRGRGIQVCRRWLDSFENFWDDMGPRPSDKHSLDRIDNNGDYTPKNCRWATQVQQINNYSRNIMIGNQTLKQYCNANTLLYDTIKSRILRGWSVEEATQTPVGTRRQYVR